ncbi:ATP-dependent RecD-like DNA helicase [Peptacetobacter hominis]|uniref:ATP-dependent RecD2 DNA helicase n=1 Tax=Peptacetobacter hominis TaxID=2743610 RepID=A0A544QWU9_9FIRM|nr:ATP-dependent RecD-like DNA helicase [Peptacetobacter hominis]TQQ85153.1 ATP-dependent RecD-like DNA helicase [Peptacetobacter hominis]
MERLEGMVTDIVFHNEENGYTIARLSNGDGDFTAVGCMPTLSIGETVELEGKWGRHRLYGEQFEAEKFIPVIPTSVEGIRVYLASGMVKGIGEKMANRIIEKFGVETLDVIQNTPDRLLEVEGIGRKKIEQIKKSYSEDRELRNIIIEMSPYGISPNQCLRIYKRYRSNALKLIAENPYRLAEDIRGIGFKTADNIARKMGIDMNSEDRIEQGILFVLRNALMEGHTYLPESEVEKEAMDLMNIDMERVDNCLLSLAYDQKIKLENTKEGIAVYLMNYFLAETSVCNKLVELSVFEFTKDKNIDISDKINEVEKAENIKLADNQRQAVKEAVNGGVTVITGGPGTGKTTTINTIIKIFRGMKKEVALAAPTGRAAKRMTETTGEESKTIHRLLEMGYSTDDELVFFRNEEEPIKADVIIVDEASMIDILLMNSLLSAIKPGTKLIIVGDSDQLPSVGAGNVLGDIIDSGVIKTVRLNEIFRQAEQSMIVVNAHKINKGERPVLNRKGKDFFFLNGETPQKIMDTVVGLVEKRLPEFYKVDGLRDIQILSPMRKGDVGVNNMNTVLQSCLNPPGERKAEAVFNKRTFRVGDKVMQIKNNYTKSWKTEDEKDSGEGIYNGDIGYIYYIDKNKKLIYVIFDESKIVEYSYEEMDEIEHSFCTTIHKSQGSEFPVVVIPISWAPPMLLSRNLLYTAITRAKKLVVLVGDTRYLDMMIKNNRVNARYSMLSERLGVLKEEGVII